MRVDETVADVLRASYYYSMVEERPVDPAMVLVAAARNDDRVGRPVLGASVADARELLCRIPPGAGAEVSGPGAGPLREAGWWVRRGNDRTDGPQWSAGMPAVLAAGGDRMLDLPDLLRAVLDSGDPSVPVLLNLAEADPAAVRDRLDAAAAVDSTPFAPFLGVAEPIGALHQSNVALRAITGILVRLVRGKPAGTSLVLGALGMEATRQAVLLGHPVVQSSAVLLAVLSMDDQLASTGRRLRGEYAGLNLGGAALRRRGITLGAAQRAAEPVLLEHDPVPLPEQEKRMPWGYRAADPCWTTEASGLWAEAARLADDRRDATAGTTHLVEALESAPAPAAHRLLSDLGAEPPASRGRGDLLE